MYEQRHHDLGRHARHELDESRIGREIVDEQRLLAHDRRADEALAQLQADLIRVRRVADRVRHFQLTAALVEQVHRKRVERNQSADQARNLRQQIVEIEDGRDLAAQVEQGRDDVVLVGVGGDVCRCLVRRMWLTH